MEHAILKTLCYADIFDYPLTVKQIYRFLINHNPKTISVIHQSLNQLNRRKKIGENKGYYYLKGRSKLVSSRLSRSRSSISKLTQARALATKLKLIPTIKAIYITGALALNNSQKKDDIDLMIITQAGWLWTTRLITNLLLDIIGIRRKPQDKEVTDKICINLWLDENSLKLPHHQRNLYTAHEITQAKPLWYTNHLHQKFLYTNRWVKNFLSNTQIPPKPKNPPLTTHRLLPNPLETLAYRFQLNYMKSRRTRETVALHSAFFHPRNTSNIVLKKYHQKLKNLNLKS